MSTASSARSRSTTGRGPTRDGRAVDRNVPGTPALHLVSMDGVRYRSYVVRIWLADPQERADTRMRVEWIAQGIEVEARGAPAADLAARLDRIFTRSLERMTGGTATRWT